MTFLSIPPFSSHVEFRYNLGNGVVALTSREKVTLGRRHRVSARRYHRDGALRLDDGDDVTGQSQGFLKALDLHQDLFLGNLPPGATQKYTHPTQPPPPKKKGNTKKKQVPTFLILFLFGL